MLVGFLLLEWIVFFGFFAYLLILTWQLYEER